MRMISLPWFYKGIGTLSFLVWSICLAAIFDHGALGPLVSMFSTFFIFLGFYMGFTRPKTWREWCRTKLNAEELAAEQAAAAPVLLAAAAPQPAPVPAQVAGSPLPVAVGSPAYDNSTVPLQAIPIAVAAAPQPAPAGAGADRGLLVPDADDSVCRRFCRAVQVAICPFGVLGVLGGLLFGMYISALVGVCQDAETVGKWAFAIGIICGMLVSSVCVASCSAPRLICGVLWFACVRRSRSPRP